MAFSSELAPISKTGERSNRRRPRCIRLCARLPVSPPIVQGAWVEANALANCQKFRQCGLRSCVFGGVWQQLPANWVLRPDIMGGIHDTTNARVRMIGTNVSGIPTARAALAVVWKQASVFHRAPEIKTLGGPPVSMYDLTIVSNRTRPFGG